MKRITKEVKRRPFQNGIWISLLGLIATVLFMSCTEAKSSNQSGHPLAGKTSICNDEEIDSRARHGGRIVIAGGEERYYDNGTCLIKDFLTLQSEDKRIQSVEIMDFNHGLALLEAKEARYLFSKNTFGDVNTEVTAFAAGNDELAYNLHFAFGGEILDWDEMVQAIEEGREIREASSYNQEDNR